MIGTSKFFVKTRENFVDIKNNICKVIIFPYKLRKNIYKT
jgi:hypothetical protein